MAPLLARHDLVDNVARIEATGPPLGAGYFGMRPEVVPLDVDDLVVLYTDGLVERRGTDLFEGIARLAEAVRIHVDDEIPGLPATLAEGLLDGGVDDDIALVQEEKRQIVQKSGVLEVVKGNVSLDDIGGLENLKTWLRKRNGAWMDEAVAAILAIVP